MSVLRRLTAPARFARARSGSTLVEFALIVPVLLLVYIGGVEVSQGIAADRKLDALTSTMGDLVARLSGEVRRSTLTDYFAAATPIMLPYDAGDVSQRITIVSVSDTGAARVVDSVAVNGATALAENAPIALPASVATLSLNNFVVMAEAWYDYTPALGFVVGGPVGLSKQHFFVPRAVGGITIIDN